MAATPRPAEAQRFLTISGGPANYDLSGTGWSGTAGAYIEDFRRSWFALDYGVSLFWYRPQIAERTVMLLPEGGVAFQGPRYVPLRFALGGGYSLTASGDQPQSLTAYAALGLSVSLGANWRARPELRVRFVDPFHGVISGFTLGVSRRLSG
ncbi:MAG: hypothetical protein AB7T31_17870 [Gemmatimonadales bacterium]